MFTYIGFTQNNVGGITVYVINGNNYKESLSFTNITIYTDNKQMRGIADLDGCCKIRQLTPGKCNVKATYKNYQTKVYKNVPVNADETTYLRMALNIDSTNTKKADTIEYKIPIIDPSTAGMPPTKNSLFPKLFFKFNSLNFDTLSNNYYENDLHIIDTNKAITYIVKYIVAHPNERIIITGYFDMNEQNPEELSDLRAEKVAKLLVQYGVPKEKMPEIFPYKSSINSGKVIRNASTQIEKEQLHKLNRCVMLSIIGGSNTAALPPKKYTPSLPRLFFKLNSINFDTLSNYYGNDLHLTDTNKVIDYVVKYILNNPDEHIIITGCFDTNEQNPEELCKQRAEKVNNLLLQYGLPKEKMPEIFPYNRPINTVEIIQNTSTEKEKEELHRANRCVMFRVVKGG